MEKKYKKKVIRIISFLLVTILISMASIFLCSCNMDPNQLDLWYLENFTIDGQTYGSGSIYNQEYVNSEYATIVFKNGKVEYNKNGETIKGTYTYKDNIGCGSDKYDNNEVVVYLENGVTYKGSSHVYAFDGAWYELELKNEIETLHFSDKKIDDYCEKISGTENQIYNVFKQVIYDQENYTDHPPHVYKISFGEQTKIFEGEELVYKFLENLNEQYTYDYGSGLFKEDLTPENNFYEYNFQMLLKKNTDPVSYDEGYKLTFYYNTETNFFYEIINDSVYNIDSKNLYTNVECISKKEKSLYKYIVELFNNN